MHTDQFHIEEVEFKGTCKTVYFKTSPQTENIAKMPSSYSTVFWGLTVVKIDNDIMALYN